MHTSELNDNIALLEAEIGNNNPVIGNDPSINVETADLDNEINELMKTLGNPDLN